MSVTSDMRYLGAVAVIAEQTDNSAGGNLMARSGLFLVHMFVSATLEMDDEEAKELAGEIVSQSRWEKAILAMPEGQRAVLPSPRPGVCRLVRRLGDAAAIALTDFRPRFDVDWSIDTTMAN